FSTASNSGKSDKTAPEGGCDNRSAFRLATYSTGGVVVRGPPPPFFLFFRSVCSNRVLPVQVRAARIVELAGQPHLAQRPATVLRHIDDRFSGPFVLRVIHMRRSYRQHHIRVFFQRAGLSQIRQPRHPVLPVRGLPTRLRQRHHHDFLSLREDL